MIFALVIKGHSGKNHDQHKEIINSKVGLIVMSRFLFSNARKKLTVAVCYRVCTVVVKYVCC